MAKGDQKNITNQTRTMQGQQQNAFNQYQTSLAPIRSDLYGRTGQDYNEARAGYSDFASTGGLTPEDMARLRGMVGGGGYGGPSGPSALEGVNFARSSAAAGLAGPNLKEANAGYSNFSKTGGFNEADINEIMRGSLKDIEATGGYSPEALARVRQQAASNAPGFFNAIKDQYDQSRAVRGNLAGANSINFKLARQGAQQAAQDRLAAEIGLNESITGNKMNAGNILSGNYLGLTGQRNANMLAGLGGLSSNAIADANFGLGKAGLIDQYNLGLGGLDLSKASGLDSYNAAQGAASAAGRGQELALEKWMLENQWANKQYGIGGLDDFYRFNVGATADVDDRRLRALESQYGLGNEFLRTQIGNKEPGWGDKLLGAGAGVVGAFL